MIEQLIMKVLIIQQKMIGDVLTSSILFEALKNKYPNSELHYLINSHTYPVVKCNPFIDKFIFITPEIQNSKRTLIRFTKIIRNEDYDTVIDIYSKLSSNLITLASNAKTKISKYKWYSSFIYSHTYKEQKTQKTNAGLAIENRLQLLQPLQIDTSKIVKPKIHLTDKEKIKAQRFLETHGVNLKQPIFMIGVLGSSANKTYPFSYLAKIIDALVFENPESQILFNYIPKQEDDAKAILNLCLPKTQAQIYFNVFGKSLRDFLGLTYYATALIGNEGGATNMAKALEVPTFTIFSPWIKKEAWNMFDDGKQNVSVHLEDYKPDFFINQKIKTLKNNYKSLYKAFKPELFLTEFKKFLNAV